MIQSIEGELIPAKRKGDNQLNANLSVNNYSGRKIYVLFRDGVVAELPHTHNPVISDTVIIGYSKTTHLGGGSFINSEVKKDKLNETVIDQINKNRNSVYYEEHLNVEQISSFSNGVYIRNADVVLAINYDGNSLHPFHRYKIFDNTDGNSLDTYKLNVTLVGVGRRLFTIVNNDIVVLKGVKSNHLLEGVYIEGVCKVINENENTLPKIVTLGIDECITNVSPIPFFKTLSEARYYLETNDKAKIKESLEQRLHDINVMEMQRVIDLNKLQEEAAVKKKKAANAKLKKVEDVKRHKMELKLRRLKHGYDSQTISNKKSTEIMKIATISLSLVAIIFKFL